jgi:hypothetical protein
MNRIWKRIIAIFAMHALIRTNGSLYPEQLAIKAYEIATEMLSREKFNRRNRL